MDKNFRVVGKKGRLWKTPKRDQPNPTYLEMVIRAGVAEPGEAVDYAEDWLSHQGIPGQSFVEITFNGDTEPHTTVYLLDESQLGILNAPKAEWPVFYPETGPQGNLMLRGNPWPDSEEPKAEIESEGDEGEEEDETSVDLDLGDDEDGDEEDEQEDESEDDSEEDGADEDEDISDDEDGDSDDDEEGEGDSEGESENEGDEESEDEMPRLKIFAKMKGPLGWRKRAEAEDLDTRNVFAFKVGVLDPDEEKTAGKREQELVAHVEFVETDEDRAAGLLRIKLPTMPLKEEGWAFELKSGFLTMRVPYKGKD